MVIPCDSGFPSLLPFRRIYFYNRLKYDGTLSKPGLLYIFSTLEPLGDSMGLNIRINANSKECVRAMKSYVMCYIEQIEYLSNPRTSQFVFSIPLTPVGQQTLIRD
uniref:Helitron_like_N domain-containing protein n=1 Tax=Heterorhabditis bacteriophora TaxID=37862 RepID=A0A1I7WWF5_HETBA